MVTFMGKSKDLFDLNVEVRELIYNKSSKEYDDINLRRLFAGFMITKAYKIQKGILLLCENGYGENAFTLTRSLFELMVITEYIIQDKSNNLLNRFIEHDDVLRKEKYEYLKERGANIDETLFSEISKKALAAQQKHSYTKNLGWSDLSIQKMCKKINKLDLYHTEYGLQCMISHINARSLNSNVDKDLTLHLGPSDEFIEDALFSCLTSIIEILKGVHEILDWDCSEIIDKIENKIIKVINGNSVKIESKV